MERSQHLPAGRRPSAPASGHRG